MRTESQMSCDPLFEEREGGREIGRREMDRESHLSFITGISHSG